LAVSFIRTIILYIVVLVSMRLMGKRQLGELETNELVVAVLISELAANPLQDADIPLLYGIIPAIILVCCEILVSGATIKSARFRSIICGKPSMLIINGKIIQKEMIKNRFTIDELTEELRGKSIMDISKVKYAILETDGSLSVLQYPSETPVTSGQMQIPAEDTGYPVILINDGQLLHGNLKLMGYNEKWLIKQLKSRNISSLKDVYLMTVNDLGQIYIAQKEVK